jgi:hypothetical protein
MQPLPPGVPGLDLVAFRGKCLAESGMIQNSKHFSFDNVAEFYALHDRQEWDMADDIPNWAPPFNHFFVEWNEPSNWKIRSRPEAANLGKSPGQVGFLVLAMPVKDEFRRVDLWQNLMAKFVGAPSLGMDDDASKKMTGAVRDAGWVLAANAWGTTFSKPVEGSPVYLGITNFIFVGSSGKYLWHCSAGIGATPDFVNTVNSALHILGLGISFCHCKNVVRQEQVADRGERWHRRTGIPTIKQYTLEIGPMRETLRREGRSEEVGIGRALHICRGHFANYTPDHPLFGKYVGTFWRPDHVRGKKEHGEVIKDYAVRTPPSNN